MWVYIVRRLFLIVPVILGVMTITFALVSLLPVEDKLIAYYGPSKVGYNPQVPCTALGQPQAGMCPNPAYYRGIHQLGLDQPVPEQWARYMFNSLTLNWGYLDSGSYASRSLGLTSGMTVATVLGYYLPYTVELAALSLFLTLLISIPLGNLSAAYRNRPIDQASRVMSFSGFALPSFLFAILLIFLVTGLSGPSIHCGGTAFSFTDWYGSWPPPTCFSDQRYPGWIGPYQQTSPTGFPTLDAALNGDLPLALDSFRRLLLPAIVIAYGTIAGILRFVRNSMLEVMNLDYVRTARAKGVAEREVVRRHAGRNSLNVTVTVLGLTFAGFVSGFPIIEFVFNLRGVGLMLAYSIQRPFDYGLIFGSTLLFTLVIVIVNLLVDILYAYLDPRVRLG